MPHSIKYFSDQLNKCLNSLDMPNNVRERAALLSKMLHIPKQQALSLIEGLQLPDDAILKKLAAELEVEPEWLLNEEK